MMRILLLLGALMLGAASTATADTRYATAPLNVRSGPGVSHLRVGMLARGTGVLVHRCLRDIGWCQISAPEVSGWSSARYLSATTPGQAAVYHPAPVIQVAPMPRTHHHAIRIVPAPRAMPVWSSRPGYVMTPVWILRPYGAVVVGW